MLLMKTPTQSCLVDDVGGSNRVNKLQATYPSYDMMICSLKPLLREQSCCGGIRPRVSQWLLYGLLYGFTLTSPTTTDPGSGSISVPFNYTYFNKFRFSITFTKYLNQGKNTLFLCIDHILMQLTIANLFVLSAVSLAAPYGNGFAPYYRNGGNRAIALNAVAQPQSNQGAETSSDRKTSAINGAFAPFDNLPFGNGRDDSQCTNDGDCQSACCDGKICRAPDDLKNQQTCRNGLSPVFDGAGSLSFRYLQVSDPNRGGK